MRNFKCCIKIEITKFVLQVVCGNCSGNKTHLPYLDKKERVCDPCHELSKKQGAQLQLECKQSGTPE